MIYLDVDLTNPGQFFGCCGVFELAQRLWPHVVAHFDGSKFVISDGNLDELVRHTVSAPLTSLDESDRAAPPLLLADPFGLRLDWWKDVGAGGRELKTWAGSMQGPRIAKAMRASLGHAFKYDRPFDYGVRVTDDKGKKAEPFYFDARRSGVASGIDAGFSINDLKRAATVSFPAVEFFSLIGLQRFRPSRKGAAFYYCAWVEDLSIALASLAACGAIPSAGSCWKFSIPFHTDYAKSYSAAVLTDGGDK